MSAPYSKILTTSLSMRALTTLSILILSLTICKAQSDFVVLDNQNTVNELITRFKILPASATTASLSATELGEVKQLLTKCITDYNDQVSADFKRRGEKKKYAEMYQIRSLSKYKVQFVPFINEKGEKEVWINGFCSDFTTDWKTEIVHVLDGGNCYFTVRLNMSNNKCVAVGTNGHA